LANRQSLTNADLHALEFMLHADLERAKVELTAAIDTRVAQLEHRLVVAGIRALVVAVGIVLAAIRYLPHG